MKKLFFVFTLTISLAFVIIGSGANAVQSAGTDDPQHFLSASHSAGTKTPLSQTYAKLPLAFEANQGQTDSQVQFLARGQGYSLFLTATGTVLRMQVPPCEMPESCKPVTATLHMNFAGAQPPTQIIGRDKLRGKSNYFINNDPQQWRANVPNYTRVEYQNLYPGFVGVDQVNVLIPKSLAGRGEVELLLTADGKPTNSVRINLK